MSPINEAMLRLELWLGRHDADTRPLTIRRLFQLLQRLSDANGE